MKRLLLFCTFIFIFSTLSAQKVLLVSVGYNGSNLRYAEKDAEDLVEVYKSKSVHNVMYELCTGPLATTDRVKATLDKCAEIARPEDTFIFFFSGHAGMQLYNGSFTYDELVSAVRDIDVANKIILINTCWSGNITNTDWENEIEPGENIMVLTSSRNSEHSGEYENMENGAFPTWLLAGLRGAADNSPRNKVVTPEEIFSYVKNGLDELSGRTGKEQHPKMKYNDKKMPVIKLK